MRQVLIRLGLCFGMGLLGGCGGQSPRSESLPQAGSSAGSATVADQAASPATAPVVAPAATTSEAANSTTSDAPAATQPAATPGTGAPKGPEAAKSGKPGELYTISFDDLNCGMQADIVFRPWMLTDRIKELDGQQVKISGYMLADSKRKGIKEFVLLRNTECKFGPGGQADHLIKVQLTGDVSAEYSIQPVEVVGRLVVNPWTGPDGMTWSIYDLAGQSVKALRR